MALSQAEIDRIAGEIAGNLTTADLVSDESLRDFENGVPFKVKTYDGIEYSVYPHKTGLSTGYSADVILAERKAILAYNPIFDTYDVKKKKEFLFGAREHVHSNRDVLHRIASNALPSLPIEDGATIPILGADITLWAVSRISEVDFNPETGILYVPKRGFKSHVEKFLKEFALDVYTKRTHYYGNKLLGLVDNNPNYELRSRSPIYRGEDITVGLLSARYKKTLGACWSHKSEVQYIWQAVVAPLDELDYLVAHEVAHLCVKEHNKKFWNLVALLRGLSYEESQAERYRFYSYSSQGKLLGRDQKYYHLDSKKREAARNRRRSRRNRIGIGL